MSSQTEIQITANPVITTALLQSVIDNILGSTFPDFPNFSFYVPISGDDRLIVLTTSSPGARVPVPIRAEYFVRTDLSSDGTLVSKLNGYDPHNVEIVFQHQTRYGYKLAILKSIYTGEFERMVKT